MMINNNSKHDHPNYISIGPVWHKTFLEKASKKIPVWGLQILDRILGEAEIVWNCNISLIPKWTLFKGKLELVT